MVGDEAFRRCINALWALIGSLHAPRQSHVEAALADAFDAVRVARGGGGLTIRETGGALHINGRLLPMTVDVFAAASGLATRLREQCVGEVVLERDVDRESLLRWARGQVEGAAPMSAEALPGVRISRREVDEVVVPLHRSDSVEDAPDSRLRSMFLQHHLIVALGVSTWVPPHQSKLVIGAVVDRMIGITGGMEPLMVLQREPDLLYRSLHVTVFAVVFARVMGWPEERLADLGAAALLHDVGQALDAASPGPAGLAWLLQRGCDEFWLRSGAVTRTWRCDHGSILADLGPGDSLMAAIVRLAVEVENCSAKGRTLGEAERDLLALSARGAVPRELVEVAVATLGRWSAVA